MNRIAAAFLLTLIATASYADTATRGALGSVAATDLAVVVAARDASGAMDVESFLDIEAPQADEIVELGSITKTVTAVAVLHLAQSKGLSLDASLGELLPDVPEDKAQITLHQLLIHGSGIVESTGNDTEQLTRSEFLQRVFEAPLEAVPGSAYSYSNAGYSLLAAIIGVPRGRGYGDCLIDEVIPDGAPAIGYARAYDAQRAITSNRGWLTGFQRRAVADASWGGLEPGWNLIGNGGAVTTAQGFLSFWAAFLEGEIVNPALVAEAVKPHIDEGKGDTFYGYGLVVQPLADGTTVLWHDGGNEIFSAEWRHVSSSGATFFSAGRNDAAFDAMKTMLSSAQDFAPKL